MERWGAGDAQFHPTPSPRSIQHLFFISGSRGLCGRESEFPQAAKPSRNTHLGIQAAHGVGGPFWASFPSDKLPGDMALLPPRLLPARGSWTPVAAGHTPFLRPPGGCVVRAMQSQGPAASTQSRAPHATLERKRWFCVVPQAEGGTYSARLARPSIPPSIRPLSPPVSEQPSAQPDVSSSPRPQTQFSSALGVHRAWLTILPNQSLMGQWTVAMTSHDHQGAAGAPCRSCSGGPWLPQRPGSGWQVRRHRSRSCLCSRTRCPAAG